MVTAAPPAEPAAPRPLDGVRVLDFTAIIAGSYCTRLLADLGADVLKVEPPGGELMRHIAPLRGEASTVYSALNAGKRSLTLDLKQGEAVALCRRLVTRYDVVVENFSPGVMARLGLDYASLAAVQPALIMCSVSGYGQHGPDAHRPAYAPIVQAHSGYEQVMLENQPGVTRPLNMGLPVADTTAALQAFGALNAALYYRARTGIGQHVDVAMQDSLLGTMHRDFQSAYDSDPHERFYGPIEAADGYIIVMPLTQGQVGDLAQCIGHPELMQDARFATPRARFSHYNELMDIVEQWARQRSRDAALAALEAAHVPCARYRRLGELADDPHLRERGMLVEVTDAAGPLMVVDTPIRYSATVAGVRPRVARLGEDNAAVLGVELGLDDATVAALVARGVVGPPPR